MKRRDFLKLLGAVPVVAAIPALANIEPKKKQSFAEFINDKDNLKHVFESDLKTGDTITFDNDEKQYRVVGHTFSTDNGLNIYMEEYSPDIYDFKL